MISKKVFDKCLDKGITMAFAESMTGGALTYEMVKYPSASKVVIGGIISYQEQTKEHLLNVDPKILERYNIVSKEVSRAMVLGLYNQTKADFSISITGNAGPTLQEKTQSLEAYITIFYQGKLLDYHINFKAQDREKNIAKAIDFIYKELNEII